MGNFNPQDALVLVFMVTTVINPVQKGVQDVDVTLPMGLVSVAHLDGQVTPVTKVKIIQSVVKLEIIFDLCMLTCFFSMYQIFVTQNAYLEHSVQIARQIVKDIVEIHVITLVECATADVKMVGWGHTAINVSKYIYMIKTTAFLEYCIIFCVSYRYCQFILWKLWLLGFKIFFNKYDINCNFPLYYIFIFFTSFNIILAYLFSYNF